MKRIVRLTESDLVNMVKRIIREGAIVVTSLKDMKNIVKGDTMKSTDGRTLTHLQNGINKASFGGFTIKQNPNQVRIGQSGSMNVVSFDPIKKLVSFDNGLVIGPV